jgi:hypothetical protein
MTNTTTPGIAKSECNGGSGDGNTLALPPTLAEDLEGPTLKKVNMILLEYARDAAVLQSRAYDAVLKIISSSEE